MRLAGILFRKKNLGIKQAKQAKKVKQMRDEREFEKVFSYANLRFVWSSYGQIANPNSLASQSKKFQIEALFSIYILW